jgi:cyclic dehypoxanthinyl futalosine synthase
MSNGKSPDTVVLHRIIKMLETIEKKIEDAVPVTIEEVSFLYNNADLLTLSRLATAVRNRFHSPTDATYLIMAIINYTNICVAKCDYCSFYRLPHESGTYLLTFTEICEKIDQLRAFGGTLVGFNGGFHPKLRINDYADLFAKIHKHYPDVAFYEMTVAEFMFSCKVSKISYDKGAAILKAAGTKWVTGGGAEILHDDFRDRHSPGKFKVLDYFTAQQAILDAGMGSTATMVIGFDETLAERLSHLRQLREFQNNSDGKLASFLCWTYKPYGNALGGGEVSDEEYFRWLAICRIYLDNIRHIRTSVLTKNANAMVGLRYGADDFDIPTEDEVTQKAGASIDLNFDLILDAARAEGFSPRKREPLIVEHGPKNFENLRSGIDFPQDRGLELDVSLTVI